MCINVVTNGDTEALCPIDGPIKWPTSFLETLDDIRKTPLPRKQWVEVTTPLAQEVGSAEIQAYFPISVFNHRYTIPKMVTTLEFPAGETDVYFNPAGAGCLTDKEGSGKCLSLDVVSSLIVANGSVKGGRSQNYRIAGHRRKTTTVSSQIRTMLSGIHLQIQRTLTPITQTKARVAIYWQPILPPTRRIPPAPSHWPLIQIR